MAKFEFLVSGVELSDEQQQRISAEILNVINKVVTDDSDQPRDALIWGAHKINGGLLFGGKIAFELAEAAAKQEPSASTVLLG